MLPDTPGHAGDPGDPRRPRLERDDGVRTSARRRGRQERPRLARAGADVRGLRGQHRRGRRRGADGRARDAARRDPARRPHAPRRRPHRVPQAARARRPHARADAHRAPRGERPRRRARRRRRRLPGEAVRARRAAGAPARAAAAHEHVTATTRCCASATSSLDPARRQAWRGDRELELTKTEFDLLELLLYNAGIVLSRDQIYERIWGFDFETSSKSLDVYISYLRRKTEEAGETRLDPHGAGSRVHGPPCMRGAA